MIYIPAYRIPLKFLLVAAFCFMLPSGADAADQSTCKHSSQVMVSPLVQEILGEWSYDLAQQKSLNATRRKPVANYGRTYTFDRAVVGAYWINDLDPANVHVSFGKSFINIVATTNFTTAGSEGDADGTARQALPKTVREMRLQIPPQHNDLSSCQFVVSDSQIFILLAD